MTKLKTLFALAAATCGLAHGQDVPPPPKPQDSGPSLEATMKFTQEKLEGVGPLNYIDYIHDSKTGKDWTVNVREEVSKVRANAPSCRIDFHFYRKYNDQILTDTDFWFSLKAVQEIKVLTREQDMKVGSARPEWDWRIDPSVFVLGVETRTGIQSFYFLDESMANRVAQAIVHAVELCGGGSKEPF